MVAVSWQQYWEAADNDMLQCCVNDKLDFVCHSIGEKTDHANGMKKKSKRIGM